MEDEVYKSVSFRFNVIFREVLSNLLLITSGAKKLRPPLWNDPILMFIRMK